MWTISSYLQGLVQGVERSHDAVLQPEDGRHKTTCAQMGLAKRHTDPCPSVVLKSLLPYGPSQQSPSEALELSHALGQTPGESGCICVIHSN